MNEIPIHTTQQWFSLEAKRLKTFAPIYLDLLLKQKGLDIKDFHIRTMNTGETSACFLLVHPERPSIIKLKNTGVFAEAETLSIWSSQGVQVPKVLDVGVIDKICNNQTEVQFLQLEAICNQDGEIAPLGYEFIDTNVMYAPEVGQQMGAQLAKMHRAPTIRGFGRFADIPGPVYSFWATYLANYLEEYQDYLFSKDITEPQLQSISNSLPSIDFSNMGSYIHGDFGIHNILVHGKQNPRVYIIDPDPQIGDPYVDVALIMFRLQISKLMYDLKPNNTEVGFQHIKFTNCYRSLLDSYFSITSDQYDPKRCAVHRITALLPKIVNREKKLDSWIRNNYGDVESHQAEVLAYKLFLQNAVEELL